MKRSCFTFLLLIFGLLAKAQNQNISAVDFYYAENDLTARTHGTSVEDQNGNLCALIKVRTTERGLWTFDVGMLGVMKTEMQNESHAAEIWVYVPFGVTRITIQHERLGLLDKWKFPCDIAKGCTYVMVLDTDAPVPLPQDSQQQYLAFQISPANATLEVNDEIWSLDVSGTAMKYVDFGTYTYRVKAEGYHSDVGKTTVDEPDKPKIVPISLIPVVEEVQNANKQAASIPSEGFLAGVFSVSATQKVRFSKGNLQYRASTDTWRFAEHQWDILGEENNNISPTYNGWIDLFGWGSGDNPTNTGNNSKFPRFVDWGTNVINGKASQWRTLSSEEWVFLFNTRSTSSGIRYVKAEVNGIKGVILLSDEWNSDYYTFNNTNEKRADFESNTISESVWINILEPKGAVFLPVAGYRGYHVTHGIKKEGVYWSNTPGSQDVYAHYLLFSSGRITQQGWQYGRGVGASVRLVCSAEN